jgi:hypothetical protein
MADFLMTAEQYSAALVNSTGVCGWCDDTGMRVSGPCAYNENCPRCGEDEAMGVDLAIAAGLLEVLGLSDEVN